MSITAPKKRSSCKQYSGNLVNYKLNSFCYQKLQKRDYNISNVGYNRTIVSNLYDEKRKQFIKKMQFN
jgi:hypothetical protein